MDGRVASAVVLAMPDPQARRLLPQGSPAGAVLDRDYDPVLALVARWPERTWDEDFDGAFVTGDDAIGWVADDGRRRGDDAPVLVAHSTPELARAHLEDPGRAREALVAALTRLLDLERPSASFVHRWTFAKPADPREADHYLGEDLIGACGDGWSAKPRVEGAWLSGRALGEALRDRLA